MAVTLQAQVLKSGSLLAIFALSSGVLVKITAVNLSSLAVTVNGVGASVVNSAASPAWTSAAQVWPFVLVQLVNPVSSTDMVEISLNAGAITVVAGTSPALNDAVAPNYTGQNEDGVGGATAFGLPTNRTMQLGMNPTWGCSGAVTNHFSLVLNRLKYSLPTSTGILTDANFNPIGTTASNGKITYALWSAGANGVDGKCFPLIPGIYTVMGDESNLSSPMAVSLALSQIVAGTFTLTPLGSNGLVNPGVNGVGKIWQWDLQYTTSSPGNWSANVSVTFTTPTAAAGSCTLSNLSLTAPLASTGQAQIPNRANPVQTDGNFLAWMKGSGGTGAPNVMRFIDLTFGGQAASNIVDPSDIPAVGNFSWQLGGTTLSASITSVQTYTISEAGAGNGATTWSSPNFYVNQQYSTAITSDNLAIAPFMIPLTRPLMPGPGGAGWFLVECVTAAPHGFKSGWMIRPEVFIPGLTITNGSAGTVSGIQFGTPSPVFVTGLNKFVAAFQTGLLTTVAGMTPPINNVVGQQTITPVTVTCTSPDASALPYEALIEACNEVGCDFWMNIGCASTDASVIMAMNIVNGALDPDKNVYLEYGNESWNDGIQTNQWCNALGSISAIGDGGTASQTAPTYYYFRSSEVQKVADAIMPGRIVHLKGGQFGAAPTSTTQAVTNANNWNAANPGNLYPIGGVSIAPYNDCPSDPSVTAAVASVASTDTRSTAFGISNPWTLAMVWDMWRLHLKYGLKFDSFLTLHQAALAKYIPVGGQAMPPMFCYEASFETTIPAGVQNVATAPTLQDQLARMLAYHPQAYWGQLAYMQYMQDGGMAFACQYGASLPNVPNDWSVVYWVGQEAGRGDGSDGKAVNLLQLTAATDFQNVSPKLQAAQDWWGSATPTPTPTLTSLLQIAPRGGTIIS